MESLLGKIFKELHYKQIVSNQVDFSKKLGYGRSYISQLIKGKLAIPPIVSQKLIQPPFNINPEYLSSLGKSGTMFATTESKKNGVENDQTHKIGTKSDVLLTPPNKPADTPLMENTLLIQLSLQMAQNESKHLQIIESLISKMPVINTLAMPPFTHNKKTEGAPVKSK